MREALIEMEGLVFSHALIDDIKKQELTIVDINSIHQFSAVDKPKFKDNFEKDALYTYTDHNGDKRKVKVVAVGDQSEMCSVHQKKKKKIELSFTNELYALVRFMKDDAVQVINIDCIQGFTSNNRSLNFNDDIYCGKRPTVNTVENIQILELGDFLTCGTAIDAYLKIEFALVWCVKTKRMIVVSVESIKELKSHDELSCNDFDKDKIYSAKLKTEDTTYTAIQILDLGSKKVLEFKKKHTAKRMKKKNFNTSDIEAVERALTDISNNEMSDSSILDADSEVFDEHDTDTRTKTKNKKKLKKKEVSTIESDDEEDRQVLKEKYNTLMNKKSVVSGDEFQNRLPGIGHHASKSVDSENLSVTNNALRPRQLFRKEKTSTLGNDLPKKRPHQSHRKTSTKQLKISKSYSVTVPIKPGAGMYNPTMFSRRDDKSNFNLIDWSDDDVGETDECGHVFSSFSKEEEEHEKTIQKIHLGWNVCIPKKTWQTLKKAKNVEKFTKDMCRPLWGNNIVNKCLKKNTYLQQVDLPRTKLSPSKMKAITQTCKYWIYVKHPEWLDERDMDEYLQDINPSLTEKINSEIQKYKLDKKKS